MSPGTLNDLPRHIYARLLPALDLWVYGIDISGTSTCVLVEVFIK